MRLRHAFFLVALASAPLGASAAETPRPVIQIEWVSDAAPGDALAFQLSAPRPNPFTTQTRFEVTIREADELTVAVHDALGRRVALLHDGALRPGTYSLSLNASALPPGLYLIRATDGRGVTATRSVALVR
jgi:hypothetical protein